MKRDIYKTLLSWKVNADRKPLILNGARQVGKTYILKKFGKGEYASFAYVNLDKDEGVKDFFSHGYDVERIIRDISAYTGVKIVPNETLVFLDEVQSCPEILSSLKYFREDAPQYHIAVAGSLLGISLHKGVSFPVGKVDIAQMYPMSFLEFLEATGKGQLSDMLRNCEYESLSAVHSRLEDSLRMYYYVGGMPEAVLRYCRNDIPGVRTIQESILTGYRNDFSKHAPKDIVPMINRVWDSIPSQLALENKKFTYSRLGRHVRGEDCADPIQWLEDSGLVYRVPRVSRIASPLAAYRQEGAMKLFPLDVGLLGAMSGVSARDVVVRSDRFREYKGAFTEAYCCLQMKKAEIVPYYYNNTETSSGEIDFIVETLGRLTPIEVKAENNVSSRSLRDWLDANPDAKAIRFSMKGYGDGDKITSIPLYAVESHLSAVVSRRRREEAASIAPVAELSTGHDAVVAELHASLDVLSREYNRALNTGIFSRDRVDPLLSSFASLPSDRKTGVEVSTRNLLERLSAIVTDSAALKRFRLDERDIQTRRKEKEIARVFSTYPEFFPDGPYRVSKLRTSTPPFADGKPLSDCEGWYTAQASWGRVEFFRLTDRNGNSRPVTAADLDAENNITVSNDRETARINVLTGLCDRKARKRPQGKKVSEEKTKGNIPSRG